VLRISQVEASLSLVIAFDRSQARFLEHLGGLSEAEKPEASTGGLEFARGHSLDGVKDASVHCQAVQQKKGREVAISFAQSWIFLDVRGSIPNRCLNVVRHSAPP
jgi:hypothetical protein